MPFSTFERQKLSFISKRGMSNYTEKQFQEKKDAKYLDSRKHT